MKNKILVDAWRYTSDFSTETKTIKLNPNLVESFEYKNSIRATIKMSSGTIYEIDTKSSKDFFEALTGVRR